MKRPCPAFALLLLLCLSAAFTASAEKHEYKRYQTIVDRQMFGPLPAGFDPTKMPSEVSGGKNAEKELTKEQEQLKSSIHFSMVNMTPDGATAVGFTDNSDPKVPVHYYLKVGEERGGWIVKTADAYATPPSMTIAKGDIEVSLSLGDNSAKGGGTTSKVGVAPAAAVAMARQPRTLGQRRNSWLSQRKAELNVQREHLERQRREDAERSEQEKAERDANIDQIRQQLTNLANDIRETRKRDGAAGNSENGGNETNDAQ